MRECDRRTGYKGLDDDDGVFSFAQVRRRFINIDFILDTIPRRNGTHFSTDTHFCMLISLIHRRTKVFKIAAMRSILYGHLASPIDCPANIPQLFGYVLPLRVCFAS